MDGSYFEDVGALRLLSIFRETFGIKEAKDSPLYWLLSEKRGMIR